MIAIGFERSQPEHFATEWETNTTNRESTLTLVSIAVGIVVAGSAS